MTVLMNGTERRSVESGGAYAGAGASRLGAGSAFSLSPVILVGILPGIALGAFFINASTGVGLAVAAGIAAGNTLEALSGAYLLRRFTRFRASLDRPRIFSNLSSWLRP